MMTTAVSNSSWNEPYFPDSPTLLRLKLLESLSKSPKQALRRSTGFSA